MHWYLLIFYEVEGANFVRSRSKGKSEEFESGLKAEFDDLYKIAIKTLTDD